jgi:hypothetical protein
MLLRSAPTIVRVAAADLDAAIDKYLLDAVGYEYRQSLEQAKVRVPGQLDVMRAAWCKEVDDAKAAELSSIARDLACGCSIKECLWNTIYRQARTVRALAPLIGRERGEQKPCYRGTLRCKLQHDSSNSLHHVALQAAQRLQKPGSVHVFFAFPQLRILCLASPFPNSPSPEIALLRC